MQPINSAPTLDGHSTPVSAAVLSPCGRTMATAAHGGGVLLWDIARGTLLRRMAAPALSEPQAWAAQFHALAFSACGTWLAGVGDYAVGAVWQLDNGALLERLVLPPDYRSAPISGCAWAPCGTQLLVVLDGYFAALWQRSSGLLTRLTCAASEEDSPTCGALSANGKHALLGYTSGSLRLFDLQAGPALASDHVGSAHLRDYTAAGAVQHCGFLQGGAQFAAHSSGELALWGSDGACQLAQPVGLEPGEALRSVALAPDGSCLLLLGAWGGGLGLVNTTTAQQRLLRSSVLGMGSAAWFGSDAGSVFCADSVGAISRFKLSANDSCLLATPEMRYARQVDAPVALAWSEGGALLFSMALDVIGATRRIWRWASAGSAALAGQLLSQLAPFGAVALAGASCADLPGDAAGVNVIALGCSNGDVALLDARSLALIWRVNALPVAVGCLQFSPDGSLLLASANAGPTLVLRTRDGQQQLGAPSQNQRAIEASAAGYSHAAFAPDNQQLLVAGTDKTVRQLLGLSNAVTGVFSYGDDSVCALAYSPDGALALVARWSTCAVLCDAQNRSVLHEIWQPCAITSACFLPDGTVVTGGIDGSLRFWRTAHDASHSCAAPPKTAQLLCSLPVHTDSITYLAARPEGAGVACASQDGSLAVCQLNYGAAPSAELLWRGASFGDAALLVALK